MCFKFYCQCTLIEVTEEEERAEWMWFDSRVWAWRPRSGFIHQKDGDSPSRSPDAVPHCRAFISGCTRACVHTNRLLTETHTMHNAPTPKGGWLASRRKTPSRLWIKPIESIRLLHLKWQSGPTALRQTHSPGVGLSVWWWIHLIWVCMTDPKPLGRGRPSSGEISKHQQIETKQFNVLKWVLLIVHFQSQ